MRTILFLILPTAILWQSCTKSNIPVVPIKPVASDISSGLSGIAQEAKVVRLETNNECLVENTDIRYLDNDYIIMASDDKLFFFSNNGAYLHKIDKKGKGPQEYNTLGNTFFDKTTNRIYVLDYTKIQVYSFKGTHITTIDKKMPEAGGIIKYNEQSFLMSVKQMYGDNKRDMLFKLDTLFNVQKVYPSRNTKSYAGIAQGMLWCLNPVRIGTEIHFMEPLNDTLYRIEDTGVVPIWAFDLGRYRCPDIANLNPAHFTEEIARSKITNLMVKETSKYFFIEYEYNIKMYQVVYDKNSKQFVYRKKNDLEAMHEEGIESAGVPDNLTGYNLIFWPTYIGNRIMACALYPAELSTEQLKSLGLRANCNPIIVRCSIN